MHSMLIRSCDLCTDEIPVEQVIKHHLVFQYINVCEKCLGQFKKIKPPICADCGVRVEKPTIRCVECERWLKKGSHQLSNQAIFEYNDMMQLYLQAYKFEGGYHLRTVFKKEVLQTVSRVKADIIVPIPVHANTYKKRGFNQVEGWLNGNYTRLLVKLMDVRMQSMQKRTTRLKLKNPFKINPNLEVNTSQSVCIVDDVYTTGTTLRHAYECLRKAGFSKISSVTLARAGFLNHIY